MIELVFEEMTSDDYKIKVLNCFKTIERPLTDGQILVLNHLNAFEQARLNGNSPSFLVDIVIENWDAIFSKQNVSDMFK